MLVKFGKVVYLKLSALRGVSMYAPASFGVLAISLALYLQPAPAQSNVQVSNPATSSSATKQTSSPKKPAAPVAAPPKAAAPAPAAPAPTPKPTVQGGTPKIEPVVTPSPASSVSGLAPTTPPPAPSTPQAQQPQVTSGYTSTNWSGYLAANAYFTSVSGSWIVPAATGNGVSTSAESSWVGIGGVTSGDLIQTGTVNIISASGQISTYAWYEMLPSASINIPSMTVSQGDSMTASIVEISSGQWTITITDNTTAQSFTITVAYASSHSSAEWIEEDPSYSSRNLIPFANFHLASFSGSSAVANDVTVNLSTSTAQPVIMVNQAGQPIAIPSVISGGTSFTVTP